MKHLGLLFGAALALTSLPALAAQPRKELARNDLARDVERAEGVRAGKNLQYAFAQYAQYGLWNEMGSLFSAKGVFEVGEDYAVGPKAIAAFFTDHLGHGHQGLGKGEVHTALIASPLP